MFIRCRDPWAAWSHYVPGLIWVVWCLWTPLTVYILHDSLTRGVEPATFASRVLCPTSYATTSIQWWFVNPGSYSLEISLVWTKSAGTDFYIWTNGWFSILTLETGISANFDVRRNVIPPWRVRQAHSGSKSPMTSQNVNAKQSRKVASRVRLRHILQIFRQEWEK